MTGQPTAAEVLAAHLTRIHFDGTGCGDLSSPGACSNCYGPSPMTAQEVAEAAVDALAAAGLLVTPEPMSVDDCLHERCADMAVDRFSPCRQQPEHDAQVAARALREAVETANREWLRFQAAWGSNPTDQAALKVLTKALAWLNDRADRIEHEADTYPDYFERLGIERGEAT